MVNVDTSASALALAEDEHGDRQRLGIDGQLGEGEGRHHALRRVNQADVGPFLRP